MKINQPNTLSFLPQKEAVPRTVTSISQLQAEVTKREKLAKFHGELQHLWILALLPIYFSFAGDWVPGVIPYWVLQAELIAWTVGAYSSRYLERHNSEKAKQTRQQITSLSH